MLLCSISTVTAEACREIACFTKTERRSFEKYFIKPSLSFCVVCSAFAWCLLLARGVNIQTLAVMHPWHDSAVTGACWSARAGHSGPPGWGDCGNTRARGECSPSAAFIQVVFIQLQLDGKPWKIYSSVSTASFATAEPKSKQFWKHPGSFLIVF